MVIRAVIRDGALHPVSPLPAQLCEGLEVDVDVEPVDTDLDPITPRRRAEIEAWYADLQKHSISEEDSVLLEAAIAEERRLGKEDAKRLQ